jgi:hypothetical protein
MIIFFFTILVVITLRFRSIIKTEHLYQSVPERFPYMFYDSSACDTEELTQCYGIVSSLDDNERYEPFKPIIYNSKWEIAQVNKLDLSDKDVFDTTSRVYQEFDEKTKSNYIQKNFPQSGKNEQDGIKKLDFISRSFISEIKKQNIDDLSTRSLILYAIHHITYNTQKVLGGAHDSVFKHLTNTKSKGYFALAIILVFTFLKSFSTRATTIIKRVLSLMMPGKGNLALQGIVTLVSSFFIPFIAFLLFLFPVFYILSLVFSLTAYYKFNSVANSFMMTKIMCLSGMIFSVVSLIGVLMTFVAFIAYIIAPKAVKKMAPGKSGKKDKVKQKEEKIAKMKEKKDARKTKIEKQKMEKNKYKKGSKKRQKLKKRIERNERRVKNKRKKIKNKRKKIKNKTNKVKNRKKKRNRSGFKDKCDNNSFSTAALWGGAGGLALLISLFNFVPLVVSISSASILSFKMAFEIFNGFFTIWNDTPNIMRENKSVLIATFLILIIIGQLIKVFADLKKSDRKYNDVGGIITILVTNFIVLFIAGLLMKSMGGGKVENVNNNSSNNNEGVNNSGNETGNRNPNDPPNGNGIVNTATINQG